MFRSAWADEIDLDLRSLAGDTVPLSGRQRADNYAKGVIALLSQFRSTQHVSTNHLISVTSDSATCTCYTVAQHYLPMASGEPWFSAGARYDLVAERDAHLGWRFVTFKLTGLWEQGTDRCGRSGQAPEIETRRLTVRQTPTRRRVGVACWHD